MAHWKTLVNQKYIGAYALQANEERTVKIKSVAGEDVKGEAGRSDKRIVIQLVNEKPLILNATNSKTIAKLYGPDTDNWAGKRLTLYASTTVMGGETVECIRVRPVVPGPAAKKPITGDRLTAALEKIELGEFTAAQLIEKYALTDDQLSRLPKQIEAGE